MFLLCKVRCTVREAPAVVPERYIFPYGFGVGIEFCLGLLSVADFVCETPPASRLLLAASHACCFVVFAVIGEKLTVPTDESFASCVEQQLDAVKEALWQEAEDNLAKG